MSDERNDYAVLIALAAREEAEVAAAALRAYGVDAFIGNSNHAYVEWLLVPALNGLQIMVPRQKLAEAKSLLRDRIRENADSKCDEPVQRRDHWKVWILVAYAIAPTVSLTAIWFGWLLIGGWRRSNWLGPWAYSPSLTDSLPLDLRPY